MHPYESLPPTSFWRSAVAEQHPLSVTGLYRKRFSIAKTDGIATAGSCFAQHVTRYLRHAGFNVLDKEPPPPMLSEEDSRSFGYGIYSARYGNIYTSRQLLQLLRDAETQTARAEDVWEKDGQWYDALRPAVEPDGLSSIDEVLELRLDHLRLVRELMQETDLLIFTLGLTETWMHRQSGTVYPTCPGTMAGSFDASVHAFKNLDFNDVLEDLKQARALLHDLNPAMRFILTVSPVPLTATASGEHVLVATTYSKSTLRAACGAMTGQFADVDYFPSYELVASPFSRGFFYESNLRSVSPGGVEAVMRAFLAEHGDLKETKEMADVPGSPVAAPTSEDDLICEETLLEAFQR